MNAPLTLTDLQRPPLSWRDGTVNEQAAFQGWRDAERGRGFDPLPGWRECFGKAGARIAAQYYNACMAAIAKARNQTSNQKSK